MAFWSSEKLREKLKTDPLIDPHDFERIKHGAYELGLGCEIILTSEKRAGSQWWHMGYKPIIPPGQIALLITHEQVAIPPDAIAFISIKATKKLGGLINISGFHVDPGFNGKLKFSVYNAGSADAVLEVGQPTFLIWFCDLDRRTEDPYDGDHQGQDGMTAEDARRLRGEIAAPQALSEKIKSLQRQMAIVYAGLGVMFIAIVGEVLKRFFWQ